MRAAKVGTEVRREQITEAAVALIGAEGLAGLSMARLAERVGIVPSALYRHYKSKEEVLDSVMDAIRSQLLANVEAVCAETPDALDRLRLLFERHIRMLKSRPAFPHVVFAHFSLQEDASRWANLRDTMQSYLSAIGAIIKDGKAQGTIRADMPESTAAVLFIGLVLPAAMLLRLTGETFDVEAHLQTAWPAYWRGLAVQSHTTQKGRRKGRMIARKGGQGEAGNP
ncbi:MAG: TetR/AcrR family transcriptional regulator [Roseovarius sp.]